MATLERKPILYFEDPIGVTGGYRRLFDALAKGRAQECSMYRIFRKEEILVYKGNRKSPGYSLDRGTCHRLVDSVLELVRRFQPSTLVITDPALLFLCVLDRESDWQWATIDNLRGGVYKAFGIPAIVTYPLTAWHENVSEKDVAAVNYGFTDQEEVDEAALQEGEVTFFQPIQTKVSVGRFCLQKDWEKIHRITDEMESRRP